MFHFRFKSKWDENIPAEDFPKRIAHIHTHTSHKVQVAPVSFFSFPFSLLRDLIAWRDFSQSLGNLIQIAGHIYEEVDVIDTQDKWMEGRIVDVDQKFGMVKVAYTG